MKKCKVRVAAYTRARLKNGYVREYSSGVIEVVRRHPIGESHSLYYVDSNFPDINTFCKQNHIAKQLVVGNYNSSQVHSTGTI